MGYSPLQMTILKRVLLCSCPLLHWIVVAIYTVSLITNTQGQDEIGSIALNLSHTLSELFQNSTRHSDIQELYGTSDASVISINGREIVEFIANEALIHIRSIQYTLQQVADQIEDLYTSFNNTGCCSVECVRSLDSYNRKECDNKCDYDNVSESFMAARDLPDNLSNSPIAVNSSFSSMFIPLNIYTKDTSVLCFAEWSENITDIFINAWKNISLHYVPYVFFGDKSGVIKTLPEYNWGRDSYSCDSCPYECVNTYDPRSRPWYVDSASGTKHVVILIDHSGSMTGSSSTESLLSSSTLISNLNENDYFIVYTVGNSNTTVVSPYGSDEGKLVRASPENILAVSKLMSQLPNPLGKADFGDSLDIAYNLLTNSSNQACHKLIFLFSDGKAVIPVEDFSSKNSDKKVSVYTFLVDVFGREDDLRELACRNKGRFTLLSDFNSIGLSIRVLTLDLNQRSPNYTSVSFSQFTAAVQNSLVITMAIPLKPYINDRTEFIGVVGVDISEDLFRQIILKAKIGPFGSSMLVTNNGRLYRHPLMDRSVFEYYEGLRTFDFSQYEFFLNESVALELRKTIVNANNESGAVTAESFLSVEHKKRYMLGEYTYYYRPLRIDLRLVVKLPSSGIHRLNYTVPLNATLLTEIKEKLENGQYYQNHVISIVGFQPNCFGRIWYTLDHHGNATRFIIMAINEALANNEEATSNCSSVIYEPILRDLVNVYLIVNGVSPAQEIESTFYQFTSGLLYCVLSDRGSPFQCNDIVDSFTNFIALAEDKPDKLIIHRGTNTSVLFNTVQLFQAITVHNVTVGVAGVVTQSTYFDELMSSQLMNSAYLFTNTSLYLSDNGGYSIGTSCPNTTLSTTSSFLGSWQPYLFNALVNNSIFMKQKVTGYHKKICRPQDVSTGSDTHTVSRGDMVGNTSTASDLLDICVSDIIFYTVNESFTSTGRSDGYVLTKNGTYYFKAVDIPNTTSLLIIYESGCDTKAPEAVLEGSPEAGEYETRNYHEYFDKKASDEICPSTTDDDMDC